MTSISDQIYADQRAAGRSMDRSPAYPHSPRAKAKTTPTGHEAYLKALETSGAMVAFEKASTGQVVVGPIKTSDKYTISVQTEFGTRVLFKHDLSEFFVAAPIAAAKEVLQ